MSQDQSDLGLEAARSGCSDSGNLDLGLEVVSGGCSDSGFLGLGIVTTGPAALGSLSNSDAEELSWVSVSSVMESSTCLPRCASTLPLLPPALED